VPPLPEFALKIAGRNAAASLLRVIVSAEVVARRGHPASFALRLEFQSQRELLESVDDIIGKTLALGTEIEILRATSKTRTSILKGIVDTVGLDLDSSSSGRPPGIIIRGYDKAHLLTREEKSRIFEEFQPSEVAARIAQEHGLMSAVDSSPMSAYLVQSGETDWDFLIRMAERIGFDVFVVGDQLHFQTAGKRARPKLTWGRGLVEFQPSTTRSRQSVDVTVRGWDPISKEVVEGKGAGAAGSGGQVLQVGDRIVRTTEEAKRLAQSIADGIDRTARAGRGLLRPGKPAIMPGATADVGGIGSTFSGPYYVDEVSHSFTAASYSTAFELGRATVSDGSGRTGAPPDLQAGTVIGIVVDNQDPSNLARVRVCFPWLGDDINSAWARLAAPMAGAHRGVLFPPEVGDEVLVAFEHGDISAPYVVGGLWNGSDRPPIESIDPDNNVRLIRSRAGHEIRLDDNHQGGSVEIATSNGHTIRLDDDKERIEIATGSAGPSILLDAASGEITMQSATNIAIESAGDLELKAAGDLTLEVGANLVASAGAAVSVEGSAHAELKSAGLVRVLGGLVTIN
jgi:phage baseplate assembly protein gpV